MSVDIEKWKKDGFYVLPAFYSHAEIDEVVRAQDAAWYESHPRVVVDDNRTGQRSYLSQVDKDQSNNWYKVNDLYLEIPVVRNVGLNERLSPILKELLGDTPVLCNSLSFERGSGQPDHVDALYMTPQTRGHLIAIWVALEDCHADAGPLRYWPGSNAIPPYVFSSGSTHVVDNEMDQWNAYMAEQTSSRQLSPVTFAAKKGDVFIWSAYLFHGGSPINDPSRTRKSIVFHYYSTHDCERNGWQTRKEGGARWLYRQHPTVDGVPGAFPPD